MLAGVAVFFLIVYCVLLSVGAFLIFLCLSAWTDWEFVPRVGSSFLISFLVLKGFAVLADFCDLLPEHWFDAKHKSKPSADDQ